MKKPEVENLVGLSLQQLTVGHIDFCRIKLDHYCFQ
jgi:hypothetical protein